ncbi:MAG: hypothetical protein XU15_C0023G0030 [candidate division NC10 bacterium CSP1-5]|nr:MAG: hypothetical protein XU15_C0023G0030 [candidate division NC10 bacterium CSP1-5]
MPSAAANRRTAHPSRFPLTRAILEALRDRTFHRLPHLRVRTERDALRFVRQVGYSFTFSTFGLSAPCLWVAVSGRRHPRWPKHTHHDPGVLLTWELKDILPAKRLVYYGKLLKGRPTLVSLELLPAFVALIREGRRSGDSLADYRDGRLGRTALRIMDALIETSPTDTPALRRRTGLQASDRTREFERAMTELQRKLWVVKTEEIYEPSFCYRWDLLENWLPEQIMMGERLPRADAVLQVVTQHLRNAIASQERIMTRLFDVSLPEVERALDVLAAEGLITRGVPIRGLPGLWVLWSGGSVAPRKPGEELEKRGKSAYP